MESCMAQTCAAAASGSSSVIFTQLIQALLIAQCSITSQHNYPVDRSEEILKKNLDFDFIIAGGGSAGSVLASRLSENPDWRVLLIERGDDPSILSDIPGLLVLLQHTSEDYAYKTVPNEYCCLGMKNRSCTWSEGKALGGSSVINGMLYVRGTQGDFDDWEKEGNDGWGYEDVRPYFLKLENYHEEVSKNFGNKFGTGGPLTVKPYNFTLTEFHNYMFAAAKELGLPILDMLNADQYIGIGKAYGTLDNGIRQNVAKKYLNPVRDRPNLYVMKSTRVDSVVTEGQRATGVKVTLKDGNQMELKASKEVIVSAGSIASPQILMLSGVGPQEELEKHNIKVVADLPVGKHLQNHPVWLGIHLTFKNQTAAPPSSNLFLLDWAYEYLIHRKGELFSVGGVDIMAFVNTKDPNSKYPNLQFHMIHIPQYQSEKIASLANSFHLNDNLINEMVQLSVNSDVIWIIPTLLHSKSIGQLKLRNKDYIEIHAPFFDNKEDIDVMLDGLDIIRDLVETKTFQDMGVKINHLNIPGCADYPTDSRDYWECNLRHASSALYHPTGSCKMGPNSQNSVVDNKLKVHGVKSLRVIDASVMPEITSGNTHAPVLMIAEKGADLIKQEWSVKTEL